MMVFNYFDANVSVEEFQRYKNVRGQEWRTFFKKFVDKMSTIVKSQNSFVMFKQERKMSNENRNRRDFGIVSSLKSGKSVREIASRVGISKSQVQRVGEARGVFSVRSPRNAGKRS